MRNIQNDLDYIIDKELMSTINTPYKNCNITIEIENETWKYFNTDKFRSSFINMSDSFNGELIVTNKNNFLKW